MNKVTPLLISVLLAGCVAGPHYEAPELPTSSARDGSDISQADRAAVRAARKTFWAGFQDPALETLVTETLANNQQLAAGLARYQAAAALLRGSRREQWPSVAAYANASDQKLARIERTQPAVDDLELYQVGAALQWELDLFGRLAQATEARSADLQASGADLRALQVALVGQLASRYFELRGLQQQLQVAEQNVALQASSLDIVSARLRAGRGTRFDQLRARAQLDATRAAIPELQAAIRTNMHRIAVLTGNTPGALVAELGEAASLPHAVPAIPVSSAGLALRQRPDVRAAERRVAAATARIGVATADLFPRFTLAGLVGSVAGSGSDLFSSGAESRHVALGIDWTFLNVAQVRARIDLADAEAAAALAEYRQAVLLALEETRTWLVRYQQAEAHVALLQSAENAATDAVGLARERYEQGYIDYFELLSAELELSRARDNLAQSRTRQALAMVNVYRCFAGVPPARRPATLDAVASVE